MIEQVKITNEKGDLFTYKAGDAFVLPPNFKGTWESSINFKKYWVTYDKSQSKLQYTTIKQYTKFTLRRIFLEFSRLNSLCLLKKLSGKI